MILANDVEYGTRIELLHSEVVLILARRIRYYHNTSGQRTFCLYYLSKEKFNAFILGKAS